jgi:crossover junction endodeoxyribonuclease RuvC
MSKTKVVVGLDMSLSSTGFCLKKGTDISLETIKTNPRTCENDLLRLQHIVKECLKRIPKDVDMVCVEDYYVPMSKAQFGSAIKLISLGTLMRIALFNKGIPFYIPTASQLKKFVTGKGNCQKNLVLMEVFKRWGITAGDDNQADACTLGYMAEMILLVSDPNATYVGEEIPKFQMETIKKVIAERPSYNVDD